MVGSFNKGTERLKSIATICVVSSVLMLPYLAKVFSDTRDNTQALMQQRFQDSEDASLESSASGGRTLENVKWLFMQSASDKKSIAAKNVLQETQQKAMIPALWQKARSGDDVALWELIGILLAGDSVVADQITFPTKLKNASIPFYEFVAATSETIRKGLKNAQDAHARGDDESAVKFLAETCQLRKTMQGLDPMVIPDDMDSDAIHALALEIEERLEQRMRSMDDSHSYEFAKLRYSRDRCKTFVRGQFVVLR